MSGLTHQAFRYASARELAAAMAPFVRAGLERGDVVFAAAKPSNLGALHAELGADGELMELRDTATWHPRPAERLDAFRRMVDGLVPGRGLTALGEPVWSGTDAVVREWVRYESVINVALADAPMTFVCLYDRAELPDAILAHAEHTHPELIEGGAVHACDAFVPPGEFVPSLRRATAAAAPPSSVRELPLAGGGRAFRRSVTDLAVEAELPPQRVDEVVLAASEVAANALRHGNPPAYARAWLADDELVCQVLDAGPGAIDPLAGWLPGDPGVEGGWGLPLARRLCDAMEILPVQRGTLVSLHVSLAATR